MKRLLIAFTAAIAVVFCGCRTQETKVVEEGGKVKSVQVKGFITDLHVETVEIEGVEYLIFYDDSKHFSVCPKVNGKHAK